MTRIFIRSPVSSHPVKKQREIHIFLGWQEAKSDGINGRWRDAKELLWHSLKMFLVCREVQPRIIPMRIVSKWILQERISGSQWRCLRHSCSSYCFFFLYLTFFSLYLCVVASSGTLWGKLTWLNFHVTQYQPLEKITKIVAESGHKQTRLWWREVTTVISVFWLFPILLFL